MKVQILKELSVVEAKRSAIREYLDSVHHAYVGSFARRMQEELHQLQCRTIDLEDAYDQECTTCMGEAYHNTAFYSHHGCCQSCFYDVDTDMVAPKQSNIMYIVEFKARANAYGGDVLNSAKFESMEDAQAFLVDFRDQFVCYEIKVIDCTCEFLHGTCIDMCEYHINDMENR